MNNFHRRPPAPRALSAEARNWWGKICDEWALDDAGLLILESSLECLDRMRAAQAILHCEGLVSKDRFGQSRAHPAVLIERDAKAGLLRGLKQLNLEVEPLRDSPGRPPGK